MAGRLQNQRKGELFSVGLFGFFSRQQILVAESPLRLQSNVVKTGRFDYEISRDFLECMHE